MANEQPTSRTTILGSVREYWGLGWPSAPLGPPTERQATYRRMFADLALRYIASDMLRQRQDAFKLLDGLAQALSCLPPKWSLHHRFAEGVLSVYLVLGEDHHETALAAYRIAAQIRQATPQVRLDFHVTDLFWPNLEDVIPPGYAPYPLQREG